MTVVLRHRDGEARPLAVPSWLAPATPAEIAILRTLRGPVLDLGCGPGRLVIALASLGIPALGIDASAAAVRHARAAGATVLHRSVFDRLPAEGRWASALLLDGNVGIGGDPLALLTRAGSMVAADGRVIVEVEPPGGMATVTHARLEHDGTASGWFPWAWVDASSIDELAASVGLVRDTWHVIDGRWFAVLSPNTA